MLMALSTVSMSATKAENFLACKCDPTLTNEGRQQIAQQQMYYSALQLRESAGHHGYTSHSAISPLANTTVMQYHSISLKHNVRCMYTVYKINIK